MIYRKTVEDDSPSPMEYGNMAAELVRIKDTKPSWNYNGNLALGAFNEHPFNLIAQEVGRNLRRSQVLVVSNDTLILMESKGGKKIWHEVPLEKGSLDAYVKEGKGFNILIDENLVIKEKY